jgi:LysM repeat protein
VADITIITKKPTDPIIGDLYPVEDPTPYEGLPDPNQFRMRIVQTDGKNDFGLLLAPREVNYDNWGVNWTQVARDGKRPYLVKESIKLPTISFSTILAKAEDPFWDATSTLRRLKNLASSTVPVTITYGGYFESSYIWRCTNFSFASVYRHPTTNAITQATVEFEFTLVQDAVISTGPVSGGARSTWGVPTKTKNLGKRKYKVKKGDTLHKLSLKFYKSSRYWRYLADLNKIKHVKPGKTIKY